jgi:formyltetrahydrofolate deformylase
MDEHIVLINCDDKKGLIYLITQAVLAQNLNIINNLEFVEKETNRFFMRTVIAGNLNQELLKNELYEKLPANAEIRIDKKRKKSVVILVSKEYHCLGDLLVRHHFGELRAHILAVISNHEVLKPFTESFGVPFHIISHEGISREDHEAEVLKKVATYSPEYLVLAKYMRILSNEFIRHFPDRIVNIHHSFLPAFIGANPYRQAFNRGVKIIGATSHFVTDALDEGPIIAQNVIPVNHTHSVKEMAKAGRDVEKIVLSQSLRLIFEDRVFVSGNRAIILE